MHLIDQVNWYSVKHHYDQYTEAELLQMCSLTRCINCDSEQICKDAIVQGKEEFLAYAD